MNRLLDIGFEPAGHWILDNGKLKCELLRHSSQKNILYAFICDGQVKYIGKTVRALAVRMTGYKTPGKTQTTNVNNHRRIKDLLSEGVAVEIFALPDSGLLHYGQFHLNLAAALEDDIIRVIDPEWNGGASEDASTSITAEAESEPGSEREPVARTVGTFSFVLQPTYYRYGFFNVGISSQKFIGADGETIELFLGTSEQPILGTINRRANTNGTPRIMGGTGLRDWFNSSASLSAEISVQVLSPTAIRLKSNQG
ncbi:MAG: GIY-YIG nuclease family protein [Proteobacteria bacterium]|nr:GIY-YIG nuclease family protein [Pseudomonadota bacterium]